MAYVMGLLMKVSISMANQLLFRLGMEHQGFMVEICPNADERDRARGAMRSFATECTGGVLIWKLSGSTQQVMHDRIQK